MGFYGDGIAGIYNRMIKIKAAAKLTFIEFHIRWFAGDFCLLRLLLSDTVVNIHDGGISVNTFMENLIDKV